MVINKTCSSLPPTRAEGIEKVLKNCRFLRTGVCGTIVLYVQRVSPFSFKLHQINTIDRSLLLIENHTQHTEKRESILGRITTNARFCQRLVLTKDFYTSVRVWSQRHLLTGCKRTLEIPFSKPTAFSSVSPTQCSLSLSLSLLFELVFERKRIESRFEKVFPFHRAS